MCTIFRFGITLTVLIIFSKLLLSCSAAITTQNSESITPSSLGTYTDGTILFATVSSMSTEHAGPSKRSFGFSGSVHGYANVTLHLLNVNEGFKHFGISCNCSELLDIRPLNPNYILLLIKEPPNILRVKVMDWTNKILSDMSIDGQIQVIGTSMNDTRFFVAGINATQLLCIEYTINNNGQIINGSVNKSIVVQPRMTIDQIISLNNTLAWGIVLKETLNTNYYNYYFLIISPETENLKPIKLNEDRIPIVFSQIACTSNNFQYYCLFISYNDLLWVKINNNFISNNQTDLFQSLCFDSAKIYTMSDIGFLVEVKTRTQIKYMVLNIGIDYDDPNNAFGETVIDNNKDDFGIDPFILPNNTIVRILNKDNEFNFLSTKPSIPEKNQINGLYGLYNNTHIKETYPSNNELIPIGTDKINITFIHTVDLTVAVNISIYLISGDENLLRQTLLCTNQYCKISDDGYSLTIELLQNTFNTPNANYSVEIDDKFLRYRNESETIPGIKRGSWIIKTDTGSNNYYSDSTNDVSRYLVGIIHLTIGGTKYYHNLSRSEKNNFIKQMGIEISNSIPVNKSRLNILSSFIDYDTIDMEDLLFIKFKIDPSADDSVDQKSAIHVFDDFTKLFNFNNNIQTYLDNNNYTRYIDKNFKPREASNLWDDIKINLRELMKDKVVLTFLIFFIILLIASCIYGRYKNKGGSNFIFFKVTLIIVDIINDVSFVIEKKDYLRELLIPGIIFIVVPLLLNTFLAFNIFIFELRKNSKFKDWFEDHSIIIRIITLFASINVQLLHILDSNFAGISLFNSPFSPRALYWIFWGEIINIFILDIPHLLIQILYALAIETYYDNLAFFTLVTSFLILLTDIIGFIYGIFAKKYEKLQKDNTEYMKELKKKEKNSL